MSASVSIIINNYNYERYIGEAIESALAQGLPAEVIVVDDGSSDRSRAVIDGYVGSIKPIYKANGGQASSFNAGFEASSGDLVLFLDADDRLLPNATGALVGLFDDGIAQAHWSMAEVDAAGEFSGDLKPERLVGHGDLASILMRSGPRSLTNSPTSGNAWSRDALSAMLPMPEVEFRLCADAYLHVLAPTYGRVARSLIPLSCWRRHGENLFNERPDPLDRRMAEDLARYHLLAEVLEARLREMGVASNPDRWKRRNASVKRMQRISDSISTIERFVSGPTKVVLVDDGDWSDGFWRGRNLTDSVDVVRLFDEGQVPPSAGAGDIVEELLRLANEGATHAAFVWPGSWVLDHFGELKGELERVFAPVHQAGVFRLFHLKPSQEVNAAPPTEVPAQGDFDAVLSDVRDLWAEIDSLRRGIHSTFGVTGSTV